MSVCLITGGSRGIGRATARLAAAAGYDIAIGYRRDRDAAEAVRGEIEAAGRRALLVEGDVSDAAAIPGMFAIVDRQLGPLTALVNSAGIGMTARVDELAAAPLARLMAVNVTGLILCCSEAARRMSTMHGGAGGGIVNISSMAATIGGRPGASAYAASKGAVDVFTKGFAKEVAAEGIRVNAVRPGVTLTDMTASVRDDPARLALLAATIPIGRAAAPEEVARAVVWLLSPEASFITGARLDVGGGGFVIAEPVR